MSHNPPFPIPVMQGPRAAKLDLTIGQGASYSKTLSFTRDGVPRDFAGCAARMQIRRRHADPLALVSLSSQHGGLVIEAGGKITIHIEADETVDLPAGVHVYDIKLSRDDQAERLVEGFVRVTPEVTR